MRYLKPWMSATPVIGFLNQPNGWAGIGKPKKPYDVEPEDVLGQLAVELLRRRPGRTRRASWSRVAAEHRAGAEQRRGLVLAVPVDRHGVGGVDHAVVDAVQHLEGADHRAGRQQVDLQPAARHRLHARRRTAAPCPARCRRPARTSASSRPPGSARAPPARRARSPPRRRRRRAPVRRNDRRETGFTLSVICSSSLSRLLRPLGAGLCTNYQTTGSARTTLNFVARFTP